MSRLLSDVVQDLRECLLDSRDFYHLISELEEMAEVAAVPLCTAHRQWRQLTADLELERWESSLPEYFISYSDFRRSFSSSKGSSITYHDAMLLHYLEDMASGDAR